MRAVSGALGGTAMSNELNRARCVHAREVAASLLLLLGPAATLSAQGPLPAQQDISRPTTSPYLNLLNNRGNSGINYFTQVRPQQQFRAFGSEISQELQGLQNRSTMGGPTAIDRGGNYRLGATGHTVTYLNTGGYYGRGAGGGMGMSSLQPGGLGGGLGGLSTNNTSLNLGNLSPGGGALGGGSAGAGLSAGSTFGSAGYNAQGVRSR